MKLLSKIYTKLPVGYITIYSSSQNEDVERVMDALKSVGLVRLKIKVEDNPDCNGSIVAQRFNIGNFGKDSVVILKDVFPLYDRIDYSAFQRFADTLLDVTSLDSSPEVVISCNETCCCESYFAQPICCEKKLSEPIEPVLRHEFCLHKEDDSTSKIDKEEKVKVKAILSEFIKPIRRNISNLCLCKGDDSTSEIDEEENAAVKAAEFDKKEYLDRISAIVLDYVTRFNEMPPMEQIEEILRGKLSIAQDRVSPITVNRDLKIILPAYNELELRLPPLLRAIYILFLRHPEGIVLKQFSDYRNELEEIYLFIKPGGDDTIMAASIDDLCDPLGDSLRQKLSRINRIVKNVILSPDLVENYKILGNRGKTYGIKLDSSQITLPSCLN